MLYLVLNGKKAALPVVRNAISVFRKSGGERIEVRVTYEYGDVARFLKEAVNANARRFIIGGGDGSVNEAVDAFAALPAQMRPELAIMPLGTANDFATACTIPKEPLEALRFAASGEAHPIDIAKANERHFINTATAGFGAKVTAETPVELKNFLGGGAYTLTGVLKALDFVPYQSKITTPEHALHLGNILAGAICNGRQAGGGQILAPLAKIDDGLLDVVAIREFTLMDIPQILREIQIPTLEGTFVKYLQVPWIETASVEEIPVNLDGEPYHAKTIRYEIVPHAVKFVIPSDAPVLTHHT